MKHKKVIADRNSSFESIMEIARSIQSLNQKALRAYTPVVQDLLHSRSRDVSQIEHTLDGLLDFCGYDPVLQLYKKLCRYYWDIDPAATASYINAYREMWDSDERDGKRAGIDAVDKMTFEEKEEKYLERAIALLPTGGILTDEQLDSAAAHLRVAFELSLRDFLKRKAGKVVYRDDWKDLRLSELWSAATERLNASGVQSIVNGPLVATALAAHPVFHHEWTFKFVRSLTLQQIQAALAALQNSTANPPRTILDAL